MVIGGKEHLGRADHDDGEDSDEDCDRHDRDREDDYEGRIMMRMMIIMVVIVTMIMRRRMLLIMVLSQWQRRGGGKEHLGVRAPNQGHRTGGGRLCKNLPIANWSPESRVPVVGILAFWFRTQTIHVKYK